MSTPRPQVPHGPVDRVHRLWSFQRLKRHSLGGVSKRGNALLSSTGGDLCICAWHPKDRAAMSICPKWVGGEGPVPTRKAGTQ